MILQGSEKVKIYDKLHKLAMSSNFEDKLILESLFLNYLDKLSRKQAMFIGFFLPWATNESLKVIDLIEENDNWREEIKLFAKNKESNK